MGWSPRRLPSRDTWRTPHKGDSQSPRHWFSVYLQKGLFGFDPCWRFLSRSTGYKWVTTSYLLDGILHRRGHGLGAGWRRESPTSPTLCSKQQLGSWDGLGWGSPRPHLHAYEVETMQCLELSRLQNGAVELCCQRLTSYSRLTKASQAQLKRIPFSRRPGTFCSHSQFHADGPECCVRITSLLQWQAQSLFTYRRNPYSPPQEPVGSTRALP